MRKLMSLNKPMKMTAPMKVLSMLLLLGPSIVLAESEYYTWIDEDGITNYSERNPQGYDAEHVSPNSRPFGYRRPAEREVVPPPSDPAAAISAQRDPSDIASEERAVVQQEISRVKTENCRIGKQNLARLESYARIRVKDSAGQERVLTDNEKALRIQEARNLVRDNCSGA